MIETLDKIFFYFRWSSAARRDFYDLAANFVADGVPVYDAVQEIGKRWEVEGNPKARVSNAILASLRGRGGKALRFGQSIGAWVPSMEAMAIDAGEQAGDIAGGLRMASRLTTVANRIRSTIQGEMTYPFMLLLMFGAFMMIISYQVVPVFASILPRDRWPSGPKAMGFMADNAIMIFSAATLFLIGILVSFTLSKGRWVGGWRGFFDKNIPPWSINRQIAGAILMTSFSTLIKSGVPFSEVIAKLLVTSSAWDAWHLEAMRTRMRKGQRDGDAMAGELFDDDVRWEIGVYGRLTSFASALDSLSQRVTDRVIKKIQSFAAVMRTGIMILIAGMIVWVYGAFFEITMAARAAH
jgi:type II secretory pathway component PulF